MTTNPKRLPAITVEVLPASFGDALLISCPVPGGTWRLLMDTGPDETYPALRKRLMAIPRQSDGRRHIDLLVISHIDHDHIGCARKMLDDAELALSFGDVWFNAPTPSRPRGVAEGAALAAILGSGRTDLPWNRVMSGRHIVTPAEGGGVELGGHGLPTLTLLSPTPDRLTSLWATWKKELARLEAAATAESRKEGLVSALMADLPLHLDGLATAKTPLDKAVANASSIAFLLEHQGASVLLGADAVPQVMVPALQALTRRRGVSRLTVDAVKLSHHGSRGNVTTPLLNLLDAQHFIVSTDNKVFQHPDDEALARVILSRARQPLSLWFNHDTPRNRRWAASGLMKHHGFEVTFPKKGQAGVRLALRSR